MKCVITGGSGYVGSRIATYLEQRGCEIVELQRNTAQGNTKRQSHRYLLGEDINSDIFSDADALVHCAYDLKMLDWKDISRVNVMGSTKLFQAAKAAGVKRLLLISSISAFEGCSSLYGRAKLAIETEAQKAGGIIIRPGLVYGDTPGGMVGTLGRVVERLRLIPIVGGSEVMYLCHEDDLAELVHQAILGKADGLQQPITAASGSGVRFKDILKILAERKGKRPIFMSLPWQLVWFGLKSAELCGISLGFKSDSLVSLMNPNPAADFSGVEQLGVRFRAFA